MHDENVSAEHAEQYVPRSEPMVHRLVSETVTNVRERILAKQTDHASLQPLPAPRGRIARMVYAFTERPWGFQSPVIDGTKVDIDPGVRHDALQEMGPINSHHVNTLRVEADPWDTNLIG